MMNTKQLQALLTVASDDVTTLKATYDLGDIKDVGAETNDEGCGYTFKVKRGLADALGYGSLVLCETKNKICVVRVLSVDKNPDLDLDGSIEYKWVFDSVSVIALNSLKREEDECLQKIKDVQRANLKAQAIKLLYEETACLQLSDTGEIL